MQSSFRLTAIDVKAKRNGEPFVWLMLEDSSGSIEALVWDMQVGRSALDLSEGDIVGVVGKIIGTFQERLQLAIDSIFLIPEPQVNAGDYPPASDDGLGTVAPNTLREKWTAMGERARKRTFLTSPLERLQTSGIASKNREISFPKNQNCRVTGTNQVRRSPGCSPTRNPYARR